MHFVEYGEAIQDTVSISFPCSSPHDISLTCSAPHLLPRCTIGSSFEAINIAPCGPRMKERESFYSQKEVEAASKLLKSLLKRYRWRQIIKAARDQSLLNKYAQDAVAAPAAVVTASTSGDAEDDDAAESTRGDDRWAESDSDGPDSIRQEMSAYAQQEIEDQQRLDMALDELERSAAKSAGKRKSHLARNKTVGLSHEDRGTYQRTDGVKLGSTPRSGGKGPAAKAEPTKEAPGREFSRSGHLAPPGGEQHVSPAGAVPRRPPTPLHLRRGHRVNSPQLPPLMDMDA